MASWSKLTYHRRLFLWLLLYSVLMAACVVVFQYQREKEFKAAELDSQLQLVNSFILNELDNGAKMGEIELSELHPFADMRVSVIDSSGIVVYDNSLDSLPGENHLGRKEIMLAKEKGAGFTVRRHSESTGNTYFYSAKRGDDGTLVRTAVPYTLSLGRLLKADYGFLWFMGLITLGMCVLGFFATRRLGQNISRLNRFAQKAEQGAKISDTEPFPHDELGDISSHIVRLYARLQQANYERDREHRAALHEQKEKERIKKQLTNNINHELKTPVASIQVCLETLLEHKNLSEEKREEFLRRSLDSTERLKKLLADVAIITRMDDGSNAIVKERVDLAAVIREVADECRTMAESKGMIIDDEVTEPLEMNGNQGLLESVFRNLIDNAVAYSGGSTITIRLVAADKDNIELSVSDDGAGIAEEHLPRIFERFYRVDKGRSRAAGGTGLGLAIVKNAVLLHGGKITAENLKEGGLRLMIILSRN